MNGGTSTSIEAVARPASESLSVMGLHAASNKTILQEGQPAHARNEQTVTTPHLKVCQHAQGPREPDSPAADADVEDELDSSTDHKMPRSRMTIDLPDDPINALYDHKLSIEDPSPKPCIVPGNALHLIDDDPSPRSRTPSSVIIISNEVDHAHDPHSTDADRSSSEPPPTARPTPRVRFRSRVRITSGLHRHRHSVSVSGRGVTATATPSSGSDSPSSSISAPLRYQADENAPWGPLGKRLSAYASAGGWQKRGLVSPRHRQESGHRPHVRRVDVRTSEDERQPDERTPLVRSTRRSAYMSTDDEGSHLREENENEEQLRAVALRREQAALFGPWPGRLFNRHWWWWHLEPIVCCTYCSEDSDYEE
ncbi:hypothetical protein AcV7_000150 [Taiwanofungus camphoratus]|nr:hypothetical protein AcV7_000150 [Antrodia cinnamomea]